MGICLKSLEARLPVMGLIGLPDLFKLELLVDTNG
jgi:hypothetical protein